MNNIFAVRPLARELHGLKDELHAALTGITDRVAFLEGERDRRERERAR